MNDDQELHYDRIRRINVRDWLLALTDQDKAIYF